METLSLIGDDSQFFAGDKGEIFYEGDGIKTLDVLVNGAEAVAKSAAGMYIVEAMAASASFFPTGLKVGNLYPAIGTEVLKTGDKLSKLNLAHFADATGWDFTVSQDKVEVTKMNDIFKKYRLGKKDGAGTIKSIFTIGETDKAGGMINRIMTTFKRASTGVVTITEVDNKPIYFCGYVRKTSIPGETECFVFGQIYLTGMKLGGDTGSAQAYDSSFFLTGIDPVFYSIDIPLT